VTESVLDTMGRPMRDLRVSVTDRCNFRCPYCMPKEVFGRDHAFLERSEILTFEEIVRVVRAAVAVGVRKVRLTGGEPTLRRELPRLVSMLAEVETPDGPLDLALTTNGSLLERMAAPLAEAGLTRVTVSLDALDDATFRAMNDVDFPVERVLSGIAAAERAGLSPLKVNMVVKRGMNEGQILPMAERFRGTPHVLRFVEFMDVGTTNGWRLDDVVSAKEIVRTVGQRWPLEPVGRVLPGDVAERWRYADGAGEIGTIASVTRAFCADCTRARLSADGSLYTCLYASKGTDVRGPLRAGATDADLVTLLASIWRARADRYSELRSAATASIPRVEMSFIGG